MTSELRCSMNLSLVTSRKGHQALKGLRICPQVRPNLELQGLTAHIASLRLFCRATESVTSGGSRRFHRDFLVISRAIGAIPSSQTHHPYTLYHILRTTSGISYTLYHVFYIIYSMSHFTMSGPLSFWKLLV